MFNNFYLKCINSLLVYTYKKNVKRYGFTPRGLFWNSRESQENRFKVLIKLLLKYSINIDKNTTRIADVGCGYGDLNLFLAKNFKKKFSYKGYDINEEFIDFCKESQRESAELFFVSDYPLEICDFSVMNGTYNYAVYKSINRWEKYLIQNLKKCFEKSKLGIIFNLQSAHSPKIVNSIFYTNRLIMEEKLKNIFSHVYSFYFRSTPNDIYFVILNR